MKLKTLHLTNFCGFRDSYFDFTIDGNPKPLAILFGPNGSGKSSVLDAIRLVSSPADFKGRDDFDLQFRKLTFNPDYDQTSDSIKNYNQDTDSFSNTEKMEISAVFDVEGQDRRVILNNRRGFEINEIGSGRYTFTVGANNPMNLSKFQINASVAEQFLDMATAIYGYECYLDKAVSEYNGRDGETITFYTDFILKKYPGTYNESKIHFKRFSSGERKIATMLALLLSPTHRNAYQIFHIDECDSHIYYKRHLTTIDKLLEYFPDKQLFLTTHSGIIIQNIPKVFLYDIEAYKINDLRPIEQEANHESQTIS